MAIFQRLLQKTSVLAIGFTLLALLCRLTSLLITPIWLDAFRPNPISQNVTLENNSHSLNYTAAISAIRQNNPYFQILMQAVVPVIFWSIFMLFVYVVCPSKITEREKKFPKHLVLIPGTAQALCGILVNFSMSGSRTAPYLQALLNNFTIPTQIVVRFILLGKRPTLRKFFCALTVLLAEFVCMLPTIFPSLESKTAHAEEGGATGPGAILWPLCFVSNVIPATVGNAMMEKGAKHGEDKTESISSQTDQLYVPYYLFWYSWAQFIVTLGFFWADIIPGFGYSGNFHVFGATMWFNIQCLFGQASCPPYVYCIGWAIILANFVAFIAILYMLRFSEGANYMVIVMSLRSPLMLLFWTLFEEHPFYWHPHPHLSTWLGIGALSVMIPAIIIYNTGPPEVSKHAQILDVKKIQVNDEEPLLQENIINITASQPGRQREL